MLSEWGRRERQWGRFPALRTVLENKPRIPNNSFISTDETFGEEVSRLLETAQLAQLYRTQIRECTALGADLSQFREDLRQLQRQLEAASRHIKAAADEIGAIGYSLESGPSENSEGTS